MKSSNRQQPQEISRDEREEQEAADELARFQPDDESEDLDDFDEIALDDERWEACLANDDELDPQPDPNDFWSED